VNRGDDELAPAEMEDSLQQAEKVLQVKLEAAEKRRRADRDQLKAPMKSMPAGFTEISKKASLPMEHMFQFFAQFKQDFGATKIIAILFDDVFKEKSRLRATIDELAFTLVVESGVERFTDADLEGDLQQLVEEEMLIGTLGEAPSPKVFEKRVYKAVQQREMAAALASGFNSWQRARLLVVGQGRAGKTSFIASLRGDKHDSASQSTVGIDVQETNVRDIGVDIQAHAAASSTAFGAEWSKVDNCANEAERAVRAQATEFAEGGGQRRVSSGNALERLLGMFDLGGDFEYDKEAESGSDNEKKANPGGGGSPFPDSEESGEREKETEDSSEAKKEEVSTIFADSDSEKSGEDEADNETEITVEADSTEKHEDFALEDSEGNSILISVWDYGGQMIFQTIQHMYMPRLGVYTLVFRITHLLAGGQDKKDAMYYLKFWLNSINTHAIKHGGEMAKEKRYPPLVLVGTYYDEIKNDPDCLTKLEIVNNLLVESFKDIECFQATREQVMPARELTYNEDQSLCFFPVDNSADEDPNVLKLRRILVDAIKKDKLDYINQRYAMPYPSSAMTNPCGSSYIMAKGMRCPIQAQRRRTLASCAFPR
jgi:GTPase SAR1 family protein